MSIQLDSDSSKQQQEGSLRYEDTGNLYLWTRFISRGCHFTPEQVIEKFGRPKKESATEDGEKLFYYDYHNPSSGEVRENAIVIIFEKGRMTTFGVTHL